MSQMCNAQVMLILTNVDGIVRGVPVEEGCELIEDVHDSSRVFSSFVSAHRSQFGRGGMITKSGIAKKAAALGISVHIANGTAPDVLTRVLNGSIPHTRFLPKKSASGKKKWIAHAGHNAKVSLLINEGTKQAMNSARVNSLLSVGIVSVK